MFADLNENILLRTITKLYERVRNAYGTMLTAKKDIEASGYNLNSEAQDIIQKVEELATRVAKIIGSSQKNPNYSDLKQICDAIDFDEFKKNVGYAEDWAKIFKKQADQAVSNPNGLGKS